MKMLDYRDRNGLVIFDSLMDDASDVEEFPGTA